MTTGESATVRYDVRFTGRVQGVFFRATTRDLSRAFDVTGFVRNERDGSVRVLAEGVAGALEGFVEAIRTAKAAYIDDVEIDRGLAATGEFDGFRIAR